ncbi:hypothetical protein [Cellvibrio japonicus]|uniref:CdiI immunity protein domain-containing protein n=1 Tax=Cellvibrio japonicus (strain Ueda107) TaxID=498211 RepID=B3PCA7_CELJU|nr:hypothetical protein [Cellvibrio japonicus]ACE84718.1 hypothetical protein CJA_1222 [Cellvibrio japonicus Ueda107]QEI11819.1 hypothetical protein FY117_05950 [Cellvibrio japonicus]QEI15393.1 hypothetical protein FY116_05950 [Cellvibrio japonicus]QEI18972.1 hypothetical protein FY115_05950 [Cellvibrio japonicus]
MDKELWKNNIFNVIRKISDELYQKDAWFGSGEKISSPEELYCELFDDYAYDDFLHSLDIEITENQRSIGFKLKDIMSRYAKSVDYLNDAEKVFFDQEWDLVRTVACEFLDGS